MSDGPSIISRTSPRNEEAKGSPNEYVESDGHIEPQATTSLDDDESNPSSNEESTRRSPKPGYCHERGKPAVRDSGSSEGGTSGSREPGGRNASWGTSHGDLRRAPGRNALYGDGGDGSAVRAGDERSQNDRHQGRRSSEDGDACARVSLNHRVNGADGHEKVRTRDKNASQHGRHRGAEKRIAKKDDGFGDAGIEYSRTAGGKGRDGTGLQNNERSMDKRDIQLHVERSRDDMSNDVSGSDGGDRECGKKTISRDVERVESRGIQPTGAGDADTAGAADRQFDTVDDKKSSPPDHGCETSVPLRAGSSENENVETIELNESVGHDCTAGGLRDRKGMIGHAQQGIDGAALENELKRSNQHGERELDEEAENDILVPQLEIVDWEGPRQGQSVTSRLHRHISGKNDLEALGSVNAILPPPKEFLASRPLKSSPRTQGEVESKHKPGGHGMECLELENGLKNGLKPAKKGRRTSAADVEWSDGAEARDVSFLSAYILVTLVLQSDSRNMHGLHQRRSHDGPSTPYARPLL